MFMTLEVIAPLLRPEQPRDIPGPHLVRAWRSFVLGMGALRPAFLNRTSEAEPIPCVRCTGRPLRRQRATTSAGERSTRSEHSVSKTSPRSVSLNARAGSGGAAVAPMGRRRYNVVGRPRGPRTPFTPTCLPAHRPPSRVCPVVEAYPRSPATFPCTSMIRCAFLAHSRAVRFAAPACVPHPADFAPACGRVSSTGPSATRYAPPCHVVRCDEYRPSRRRT